MPAQFIVELYYKKRETMLQHKIFFALLAMAILPFSVLAQNQTDTTVTVKDGKKVTTVTIVEPIDSNTKTDDTTGQYAEYLASIDTTSLGSNLNLQAVAELFRTSKDLEEFEKKLNDEDEGVNNLDLNEDGKTDYLRVVDHAEKNTHVVVIQAVIGKDQFQDVASIDVVQDGDKVSLQIVGDEDIYGTDYYIEPEKQEEVKNYPSVQIMFVAGYSPYHSPYYWGYYPPYYHPWHPHPAYYYHRHVYYHHHYHHHHYHHGHHHMSPHARSVYNTNRRTAPINKTKRYNSRAPQRPVNKTQARPSTRPSQPSTRPAQKPQARPAKPSTRPSTKPAQKPTKPSTRPAQPRPSQPKARPAQPRPSQPKARPATPRPAPRARPAGRPGRR